MLKIAICKLKLKTKKSSHNMRLMNNLAKMSKNHNICKEIREILLHNIKRRKYSNNKASVIKLVHIPHINKKEERNWSRRKIKIARVESYLVVTIKITQSNT